MKKIYVLALMLAFVFAGCNDEDNGIEGNDPASENTTSDNAIVTAGFDEAFARELFKRGYIDDPQNITKNDVANITELRISYNYGGERLTSLKGIEYFSSLEKLFCSGHELTTLDLSNNTVLTSLDCSANFLTSLDLSNNTVLTDLACLGNALTTLDLSNNTKLEILYCLDNALTTLDLSNNTVLTDLACLSNALTSLDVSNNTALTSLDCSWNPGDGSVFPVFAWFDDTAVPSGFTTGSWDYQGSTVSVRYQQK